MSKEIVVVTGGAGFIGSHIVRLLLDEGFDVRVIDNYAAGKHENRLDARATYHEVDIRDYDALVSVVTGAAYVFHLAAVPSVQYSIEHPELTNEVNVSGTLNVLRAAVSAKVRKVIYSASGGSVYGDPGTIAMHEGLAPHPISPYGLQKHIGELYCRLFSDVYGLPTVSLRYFNVFGPQSDPHGVYALVIGKFLLQRSKGEPMTITGDGTQTRDFVHVRDIARANLIAAKSGRVGKGEMINIGSGRATSVKEIAELIGGPVLFVPVRLEPHDSFADNSLAKEILGWKPTITIEEGIAELKREWNID